MSNTEFQINTHTNDRQSEPSITSLSDGGFVVTWQSWEQDGHMAGIYAQMHHADGYANGTEFQVNTYTTSWQSDPSTTALHDGGFIVTWQSDGQDDPTAIGGAFVLQTGIFAQRYDSNGDPNGAEFQVNTYTSGMQAGPRSTALSDGGFIVTWTSESYDSDQDGDRSGSYAQRYDANGDTKGTEFQVNTYTSNNQTNPSTTTLSDGGFIITWSSFGQDGDQYGVYAQRYDANGNANGTEFRVNTETTGDQSTSHITTLVNGSFVITWQSEGQDGDGYGIYAQRYNSTSTAIGDEFRVNTYTIDGQYSPTATALSDGGFIVTWYSYNQDGSDYGVYAQRYDAQSNALGEVTLSVIPNNEVAGTTNDDILNGTAGIDEISTGLGADLVYAQAGNDTITLTADSTWSAGYSAQNVGNQNSYGTTEKIALDGFNRFNDLIDGGDDVDTLNLTVGDDAFFIDDVYSNHHSSLSLASTAQGINSVARVIDLETINAGEGNDIVDLSSPNFILSSAVIINGGGGNDHLWGSNGNDVIDGGSGDDSLFGGSGDDTLTGGLGSDTFQFTATSASDDIIDFDSNADTIELYYRETDQHTAADLDLTNGILTWSADGSNSVLIDMSVTTTSSDLNDLSTLITFVEII